MPLVKDNQSSRNTSQSALGNIRELYEDRDPVTHLLYQGLTAQKVLGPSLHWKASETVALLRLTRQKTPCPMKVYSFF